MYIYCTHSSHMLCISICPLAVQSHTTYDEAVTPLTRRKCSALNGNSVFNLHDKFQEHNPGMRPACFT